MMAAIKAKGFSLIEFMVVMVIAIMFAIIMVSLLNSVTHRSSAIKESIDISKTSRISLFAMARDLGNAGFMLNCVGVTGCGDLLLAPNAQSVIDAGYSTCAVSNKKADGTPCTSPQTPAPSVAYISTAAVDKITINYAGLAVTDLIQVTYSLTKATSVLSRKQVKLNDTAPATDDEFASNVVQMAFKFGVESGTPTVPNFSYNNTPPATLTQLRSVKVALLVRSELPDKEYTSPPSITWLGGAYAVPADQLHYRFNAVQQEVYIINPTLIL
jgi:Tfp pilus assembly major pilin PilA